MSVLEENEDYQRGYDDGLAAEKETIVDAYYDGYRRGHRDGRRESYSYGLYTGVLIGTITTMCCGLAMYVTNSRSLSSAILSKIRHTT
jgi:hypothetical protein